MEPSIGVDVASVSAFVSSLLTAGTVLWKGGALVQQLKELVAHSEKTNGIIAEIVEDRIERGKSIARCQAMQERCLEEHAAERAKVKG